MGELFDLCREFIRIQDEKGLVVHAFKCVCAEGGYEISSWGVMGAVDATAAVDAAERIHVALEKDFGTVAGDISFEDEEVWICMSTEVEV